MNRAEQILSKGGRWVSAESLFDDPPTDAPRPVLESERPRVCGDCGATFTPSKGASQSRCASCWGKATSARRGKSGRFGIARR